MNTQTTITTIVCTLGFMCIVILTINLFTNILSPKFLTVGLIFMIIVANTLLILVTKSQKLAKRTLKEWDITLDALKEAQDKLNK